MMTEIPYKEWVEALRSGDYKQTKGTLKGELPEGGVGYCCLGVLAEIMGYEVKVEPYVENGEGIVYEREGPDHIYEEFACDMGEVLVRELINHNDYGMSFKKIANIIIEKEKM